MSVIWVDDEMGCNYQPFVFLWHSVPWLKLLFVCLCEILWYIDKIILVISTQECQLQFLAGGLISLNFKECTANNQGETLISKSMVFFAFNMRANISSDVYLDQNKSPYLNAFYSVSPHSPSQSLFYLFLHFFFMPERGLNQGPSACQSDALQWSFSLNLTHSFYVYD